MRRTRVATRMTMDRAAREAGGISDEQAFQRLLDTVDAKTLWVDAVEPSDEDVVELTALLQRAGGSGAGAGTSGS